jgi:hypothetical protein
VTMGAASLRQSQVVSRSGGGFLPRSREALKRVTAPSVVAPGRSMDRSTAGQFARSFANARA